MIVPSPSAGDIVLYRASWADPLQWPVIPFSPRFTHVSICTSPTFNRAVAAQITRGVAVQWARGSDAVYVSMAQEWDASAVTTWLQSQIGKPYDVWAWFRSALGLKSPAPVDRFDCSSLVGLALQKFARGSFTAYRETRPDDIAKFLGVA